MDGWVNAGAGEAAVAKVTDVYRLCFPRDSSIPAVTQQQTDGRQREREKGTETKKEVMRRQIKEEETAVVAVPDEAELFMRPRFSPHYETKSDTELPRQPGSQSARPKQAIRH